MQTLIILFLAWSAFTADEKPRFKSTSIETCQQEAAKFFEQEKNFSQLRMNLGTQAEKECVTQVMNRQLDLRLLKLKKNDPKQFQFEMNLQRQFNQAVQDFEEHYRSQCSGSACGSCTPGKNLAMYRAKQATLILQNKLLVDQVKAIPSALVLTKKVFGSFAENFCKMPSSVWATVPVAKDCQRQLIGEIADQIRYFFAGSGEEGDVCAQL